jgi:hypothetical protein
LLFRQAKIVTQNEYENLEHVNQMREMVMQKTFCGETAWKVMRWHTEDQGGRKY